MDTTSPSVRSLQTGQQEAGLASARSRRKRVSLFLTEHAGDCQIGGAAYFVVDDVDALYREIRGRGIRPSEPPEDTPWQTREMNVIDPDGNRLRFANPTPR